MTDNNDDYNEKNIKVYVRILPLERTCESRGRIDTEHKKIYVRCLQNIHGHESNGSSRRKASYWCFQTDGVFYNASQEQVYRDTSQDLVSKVLGGASCVLMGYGQTGSGKSFTVSGLRNNWEHRGLLPRLLSTMFAEKLNRKKASEIQYHVSFVELRGKEARDLLCPDTKSRIKISDRDPFKEVSLVNVANEEDALKKIFEGETKRSVVKGLTYPTSHLGTAVITFHASNVSLITSWGVTTTAKMHIVEMAGTGTVKGNVCCKSATDIGAANLTKIQLEQFFSYLAGIRTSTCRIIRSSNLLKILGNALSVSSVVRFISHVRITEEDLEISLSTLRFTARIVGLRPVKVREDVKFCHEYLIQRLQDEVNSLKKELMINDLFSGQEALMNISKSRMEQINQSILDYLSGTISDFMLYSVSQAQVLLQIVKDLYKRLIAKELEMEKLKETHENSAETVSSSQASVNASKEAFLNIAGRKKSKSLLQDSLENKESLEKSVETREEVGSLGNKSVGVTLGPYVEDKKEMEKKGEDNGKCFHHISEIMKQFLKADDKTAVTQKLFERFLKEEDAYARTKEQLDRNERILSTIRQRFSNSIDKCFQTKRNLEIARNKLSKEQQVRSVLEPKDHHDTEEEIIPKVEVLINKDIACYQKTLLSLEEEVTQTQNEIHELHNVQDEARTKLTAGFREFCGKMDLLPLFNNHTMKILLESTNMEQLGAIRQKFNVFQRSMIRTEERNRMKKTRAYNKQKSKRVKYD